MAISYPDFVLFQGIFGAFVSVWDTSRYFSVCMECLWEVLEELTTSGVLRELDTVLGCTHEDNVQETQLLVSIIL